MTAPEPPTGFGPYRLDRAGGRLLRDDKPIPLGRRAFDTLLALLDANGETLSKDTLLATVWPGLVVEENNLQVQISALRKALGDGWIATVPGRGYRLATVPPTTASPPTDASPPLPDRPSIAVLPFANLSGDPDHAFVADGIAEDILTELSRDHRLFVIARASSFAYRDRDADIRAIGRDLGVRYVLDGSLRRAGDAWRLTVRLNDAVAGTAVWSERYDRAGADLLALQDEITAAVTLAVGIALDGAERERAASRPTANLSAWESYQRGMWHWARGGAEETRTAIGFFERAHQQDPAFALPLLALARTTDNLTNIYAVIPFDEGVARSLDYARRALALNPNDADSLAAVALLSLMAGDREASSAALRRAEAAANAGSVYFHRMRGLLFNVSDRPAEGRASLEQALRLDPQAPTRFIVESQIAYALFLEHRFAEAEQAHRAVLVTRPDHYFARLGIAVCLVRLGRIADARSYLAEIAAVDPVRLSRVARQQVTWFGPTLSAALADCLRIAGWAEPASAPGQVSPT